MNILDKNMRLSLIITAFLILTFISLSSNVFSKPLVKSNLTNTLQINNFSTNISLVPFCDLNYKDITSRVLNKLLSVKAFNGGVVGFPQKVDEQYYIFSVSNLNRTFFNYYLYDLGVDGLWTTRDDFVYFVTNASFLNFVNYGFLGMISENGSTKDFYWSMHNGQTLNPGLDIYSCSLSTSGCNSSLVAFIPDPYNINALLPYKSSNKLFIAIEDTSIISSGGAIVSCSLISNLTDSCYSNLSSFNTIWPTIPFANIGSFKDHGFIIDRLFYSVKSSSYTTLPLGSYVVSSLKDILIFFRINPNPVVNITDLLIINTTSSQISTLYTEPTRIQPFLASFFKGRWKMVYGRAKQGSYSHFIRLENSIEIEINRSVGYGLGGWPISIQPDNKVIVIKQTNNGNNNIIYRSNCKA